ELEPIWQTPAQHCHTITTVRHPILQAVPEVLLAGDSGPAALRVDGPVIYTRPGQLLAPPIVNGADRSELIALERLGSSVAVSWLDPATGGVLTTRPLDSGGDALWTVSRSGLNESELVVATSDPPTLYRF